MRNQSANYILSIDLPKQVEAIQYNGENSEEIKSWANGSITSALIDHDEDAEKTLYISLGPKPSDRFKVQRGQYFLHTGDDILVMDAHVFETLFHKTTTQVFMDLDWASTPTSPVGERLNVAARGIVDLSEPDRPVVVGDLQKDIAWIRGETNVEIHPEGTVDYIRQLEALIQ